MRTDKELLQDAVDAIEAVMCTECAEPWGLIEEIRARLAEPEDEPEDEPVAWFEQGQSGEWFLAYSYNPKAKTFPLYRHPRQPVRLTDEEIDNVCFVWRCRGTHLTELVRDMESKFLEKNQ